MFDLSMLKNILNVFVSCIPLLLGIGVIILIIAYFKFHVRFKYKTFFRKGFLAKRGKFGLYVYCGAQGKGKTFSLVEYLIDNSSHIICYSNVYNIKNVENITYFTGFKGLIDIKNDLDSKKLIIPKGKQLVIVFDEVFTEIARGDKLSKEVLDFLCQMRKRKIIFLTTAQYWSELPITYRRFARFQIDCNIISFLWFSVLVKTFHDAERMKWSAEDMDFIAPITDTTITKCRKKVADSYDTFLRVSNAPIITNNSSITNNLSPTDLIILTGDKR